jgi:hypothetical protein
MNGDKIPAYKKAKGSAGVSGAGTGVKSAPKTTRKGPGSVNPAGATDSRPQNSDRTQSAR